MAKAVKTVVPPVAPVVAAPVVPAAPVAPVVTAPEEKQPETQDGEGIDSAAAMEKRLYHVEEKLRQKEAAMEEALTKQREEFEEAAKQREDDIAAKFREINEKLATLPRAESVMPSQYHRPYDPRRDVLPGNVLPAQS